MNYSIYYVIVHCSIVFVHFDIQLLEQAHAHNLFLRSLQYLASNCIELAD